MVIWYYHLPIKNIWIRSFLTIKHFCISFFSLNVYFNSISSTGVDPNVVYFYTRESFTDRFIIFFWNKMHIDQ